MDLKKWAIEYIRHKDVFLRQIVSVEEKPDGFLIKYKAKEELVVCSDALMPAISRAADAKHVSIYCTNTKVSFDLLVHKWNELAAYEGLTIFFVNPDSQTDTKWVIRPNLHNRVADEESLKAGLQAMFETVEMYNG